MGFVCVVNVPIAENVRRNEQQINETNELPFFSRFLAYPLQKLRMHLHSFSSCRISSVLLLANKMGKKRKIRIRYRISIKQVENLSSDCGKRFIVCYCCLLLFVGIVCCLLLSFILVVTSFRSQFGLLLVCKRSKIREQRRFSKSFCKKYKKG